MFGPKTKTLVQLEHYLQSRTSYKPKSRVSPAWMAGAGVLAAGAVAANIFHMGAEWVVGCLCAAGIFASRFAFVKPAEPETPTDQLLSEAEVAAEKLKDMSTRRRLHLVLHPGVAAILNECAALWQRIQVASDKTLWQAANVEPHWLTARNDWLAASDLAMAEALVLTDKSILLRPNRHRAEEVVEDILDTYVFKRPAGNDLPLPATFQPLRELAEKMKILAEEVEASTRKLNQVQGEAKEPAADASTRLDQVLGELRSIHQAESELGQNLRA